LEQKEEAGGVLSSRGRGGRWFCASASVAVLSSDSSLKVKRAEPPKQLCAMLSARAEVKPPYCLLVEVKPDSKNRAGGGGF
jgi:hypothetical protein